MSRKRPPKRPITGYWLFICNTRIWEADRFLETGEADLLYKIRESHKSSIQVGQRGLLRVGDDRRSKRDLAGRPQLKKGIYAVLEIDGNPKRISDPDSRFYRKPEDARKQVWRVPVRVVANLLANPILAVRLPEDAQFASIQNAPQAATAPILPSAFQHIVELAISTYPSTNDPSPKIDDELSEHTLAGVFKLESKFLTAEPKIKASISRRIERGTVGKSVKKHRQYRCQVCETLGRNPIAFLDRKGLPYAEAHHVIPVHLGVAGSLHYLNIMVLCPNHHRQAHYGHFKVLSTFSDHWKTSIDNVNVRIDKPNLLSL